MDKVEMTEYLPGEPLAKLATDRRILELGLESGEPGDEAERAKENGLGEKDRGRSPDRRWYSMISCRVAPRGRGRVFSGIGIVGSRLFLEKPPL